MDHTLPTPVSWHSMKPTVKRAAIARYMSIDDSASIDRYVAYIDDRMPRPTGDAAQPGSMPWAVLLALVAAPVALLVATVSIDGTRRNPDDDGETLAEVFLRWAQVRERNDSNSGRVRFLARDVFYMQPSYAELRDMRRLDAQGLIHVGTRSPSGDVPVAIRDKGFRDIAVICEGDPRASLIPRKYRSKP